MNNVQGQSESVGQSQSCRSKHPIITTMAQAYIPEQVPQLATSDDLWPGLTDETKNMIFALSPSPWSRMMSPHAAPHTSSQFLFYIMLES